MVAKNRYWAFLIHIFSSLVVFTLAISVLILLWYPPPFYRIEGLWDGLRIAACVDLILGPAITLGIYRPGKKGLKSDLVCIVLFQLIALTYGMVTIYQQRPYFVVFTDDNVRSVRWRDITGQGRPDAELEALHAAATGRPPIVAMRPPATPAEKQEALEAAVSAFSGTVKFTASRVSVITPELWKIVRKDALSDQKRSRVLNLAIDRLCQEKQCNPNALAVFQLTGRFDITYIAFDWESGKLVGYPSLEK